MQGFNNFLIPQKGLTLILSEGTSDMEVGMGVGHLIQEMRELLEAQLSKHSGKVLTKELIEEIVRASAHRAAPSISNYVKEILKQVRFLNLGMEQSEATVRFPREALDAAREFAQSGDVDSLIERLKRLK